MNPKVWKTEVRITPSKELKMGSNTRMKRGKIPKKKSPKIVLVRKPTDLYTRLAKEGILFKDKELILRDYPANKYPEFYEEGGTRLKDIALTDLCSYIRILSQEETFSRFYSEDKVDQMIQQVENGTYCFGKMSRWDIPKPHKGLRATRPITAPCEQDALLFAGMLEVLNDLDKNPSQHSHGFHMLKGTHSFFNEMATWPALDQIIQCDLVKCFDSVDRDLLFATLRKQFGPFRWRLVDLIQRLLSTPIIHNRTGEDCNTGGGLTQGSPVSPILLNFFLHPFDEQTERKSLLDVSGVPRRFYYWLRYADDLVFGFPKLNDQKEWKEKRSRDNLFFRIFWSNLKWFKMRYTFNQMIRPGGEVLSSFGKTKKELTILGLPVTLDQNGDFRIGIPKRRWRELDLSFKNLSKKKELSTFSFFFDSLFEKVCGRALYAIQPRAHFYNVLRFAIHFFLKQSVFFIRIRKKRNWFLLKERQRVIKHKYRLKKLRLNKVKRLKTSK
jgi:hypothetical protein